MVKWAFLCFLFVLGCVAKHREVIPREPSWNKERRRATTQIEGCRFTVIFEANGFAPLQDSILAWISTNAHAVAAYYGKFPSQEAAIFIRWTSGRGVGYGSASGYNGAVIELPVGRATTQGDLERSWMLCHEMMHLGFPSMASQHRWIEEGMASYLEPIVRARAGLISREKVWKDMVLGLPYGLPQTGDRGLDHTPTWGRVYWGGALYWLLADIEIRKRTQNRYGVEHALRGIVNAGGDITAEWEITHALAQGDKAVGVMVLTELYDKMKDKPLYVDLAKLWQQLGVVFRGGKVTLRDAPLASVREAITQIR